MRIRKARFYVMFVLTSLMFLQTSNWQLEPSMNCLRIPTANAAPIMLTGNITISELIVDRGKSVVVSGSTIILTGNITVKDDGQLLVIQSRIQMSIRGEKTYNVSIHNSGTMTMQGSVLEGISGTSTMALWENSHLTLANSEITGFAQLRSLGNSTVTAQGATLNVGSVDLLGSDASLIETSMPKGKLSINATTAELVTFKGDSVFMNASKSTLRELDCNTLELHSVDLMYLNNTRAGSALLDSRQKIIVTDSTFDDITYLSSGIATNVTVTVKGIQSRAGGPIYAGNNTTVLRYWYLKVNVTDLAGTGVPAQITVTDYMNKTDAIERADVDGIYLRAFPAEIVNETRAIFIGNYRIKARYLNFSTASYPVALDGNKILQVRFTDSIPIESTTKLTISTNKIRAGDKVRFEGYINTGTSGEFVEVYAVGPGNSTMQKAFTTDKNGAFKGEYTLSEVGQWYVYAQWLGGSQQGISTRSQAFIVMVEPRPSVTLLLLRALPVVVIVFGVLIGVAFLALSRRKKIKI